MHDIKFIRSQPDAFDAGLKRRGLPPQAKEILALDAEKRKSQTELQELLSKRNAFAKQIGMAKAKGEDVAPIMEEAKSVNERITSLEAGLNEKSELENRLASLPNIPATDVPEGEDEQGNVCVREWGAKPEFAFQAKEHFDLGEKLGLMDFEAGAKLSGARFVVLKGQLAKLERALAAFFLDQQTEVNGYTEVAPPYLVRDGAMFGTGQLPKFEEDLFKTTEIQLIDYKKILEKVLGDYWSVDQIEKRKKIDSNYDPKQEKIDLFKELDKDFRLGRFYLIPTAEVPLTNLVADSILAEDDFPIRYTAYTPCFRSEAGSAGRDTRGMIRQHQFSKVEMVSIVKPEDSVAEHERMTACAEKLLQALKLPYRVMLLCTGDMGFSATKTYDLEVWLPGQGAYREISSCSNCGDFQARRMKARFKRKGGKETEFVHTLNGSGLPIGRTMVAILENYQQEDGSIIIPEVLRPYMGGLERIG